MFTAILIKRNGTVATTQRKTWREAAEWIVEYRAALNASHAKRPNLVERVFINDGVGTMEYDLGELERELQEGS